MLKLSHNTFPSAAVGDTVKVPISDVDRSRTHPRNLLCAIISLSNNFYILETKQDFTRNQFTVYSPEFVSFYDVIPKNVNIDI